MNIPKKLIPIDLGDGFLRFLWFSAASAQRIGKQVGGADKILTTDMATVLPVMIFEGLTEKDELSVEILAESLPFDRIGELQKIVVAALAGMTVEEAEAKAKAAAAEAAKNAEGQPATIQ
jgi:hypothetical protein